MDKSTLQQLINHWMNAESILRRMRARIAAGGSGSDMQPALDQVLEAILELSQPEEAESDSAVLTIKGHRIKNALVELELGKLSDDRARIIHWSAILIQATSELVGEYLVEEAQAMSQETDSE